MFKDERANKLWKLIKETTDFESKQDEVVELFLQLQEDYYDSWEAVDINDSILEMFRSILNYKFDKDL